MSIDGTLRLDRVVSSQPELGPSVPDGGYGWVILVCSLFVQVSIRKMEMSSCESYNFSMFIGDGTKCVGSLWCIVPFHVD